MFGADLQSIVEREHENLRDDGRENDGDDDARKNYVPRLVRQCIDEVEKRGMQVRVCLLVCGMLIDVAAAAATCVTGVVIVASTQTFALQTS